MCRIFTVTPFFVSSIAWVDASANHNFEHHLNDQLDICVSDDGMRVFDCVVAGGIHIRALPQL